MLPEILDQIETKVVDQPKEYDLMIENKEQWNEFENGFDTFLNKQSEINYDPKDELDDVIIIPT